jgi:hypothetical protein
MPGKSRGILALVLAASLVGTGSQSAVSAPLLKDGFTFVKDRKVKIVVFRPDVQVGTMQTAGIDEPNVDWTATGRDNIQKAMQAQAAAQGLEMTFLSDLDGPSAELLNQNRALFTAVASAVSLHGFTSRLPTKMEKIGSKKSWRMDWTLGQQATRLRDLTGGDYALFLYSHDAYSSGGRKAAVIFAAMWGVAVPFGIHEGYAGLVDLRTGDLVWFNANPTIGGDPRQTEGAVKRVAELLAGFPGSVPPAPAGLPKAR